METAPRVWVVRGGRDHEIAGRVSTMQAVGVSFRTAFDLATMPTRTAVLPRLEAVMPERANAGVAGRLFRLAHDIEIGDLVLTPEKGTRQVHVGRCAGPSRLAPAVFGERFPHTPPLAYLTSTPWASPASDVRTTTGLPPRVLRADVARAPVGAMNGG